MATVEVPIASRPEQRAGNRSLFKSSSRAGRLGARTLAVLVLAGAFSFPFIIMAVTSFKGLDDIFHAPPTFWPTTWTLANFRDAFDEMPFWRYLGNTMLLCS